MGIDENGFGDYWNRAINSMIIFHNKLYVTTGISYEYGAQAWCTEDGENWTLIMPERSFDIFHDNPAWPGGKKPVVVTILNMCPSSVSGEEVLYAGGTGSTGNAGRCSRYEYACAILAGAGVDTRVAPCAATEFPMKAPRPADSALSTAKLTAACGHVMRGWQAALTHYLERRSNPS